MTDMDEAKADVAAYLGRMGKLAAAGNVVAESACAGMEHKLVEAELRTGIPVSMSVRKPGGRLPKRALAEATSRRNRADAAVTPAAYARDCTAFVACLRGLVADDNYTAKDALAELSRKPRR